MEHLFFDSIDEMRNQTGSHGSHKCTAADQTPSVQHPGCIPNWEDRGYSIAASQILPPSKILNFMLYYTQFHAILP